MALLGSCEKYGTLGGRVLVGTSNVSEQAVTGFSNGLILTLALSGRNVLRMSQGFVFCSSGEVSRDCDSFPAGPVSSPVHMR